MSLVDSTYGRGFLAVRDDEIAAEAMGINTTKYKVLAFVLGAFFAGIAGGLYAHFKQFIHPEGFNFMKSVDDRRHGHPRRHGQHRRACASPRSCSRFCRNAALVSQSSAAGMAAAIAENRMIIYSLLLIILMLTRPQGLFGVRRPRKARRTA